MTKAIDLSGTPKLGFGMMRLPKLADDKKKIDIEQTCKMVDLFMEAGFTYFDTAYVYDGGASEEAVRKALVERYPRDSYTIATKLNAWLGKPDEAAAKQQLETSLERLGVDYVDYYLLHALQLNNRDVYADYKLWDFVRGQKEKGLIRHWGFSFHGTPEMLDDLLKENPDAEFVQLQINYADWEDSHIASRACYEIARKHNKPIVVMEPVKGGTLANPPEKLAKIFKEANPDASYASWAIRYVASLDGILTVLSGMSNIDQMKDNLSYMKDFKPLNSEEQKVIGQAQQIIRDAGAIPCTACHYCTKGCPQEIPIPDIFRAINMNRIYQSMEEAKGRYTNATAKCGKASDCIQCGQCEDACPQSLPIIELLQEAVDLFE
ncbi:MAG: aldo/keto reductase [Eubacterium sp.]|nr:aldo/keto reductase [Eubacterium sp.]